LPSGQLSRRSTATGRDCHPALHSGWRAGRRLTLPERFPSETVCPRTSRRNCWRASADGCLPWALVRRPRIYLFDDSFSALDLATDPHLNEVGFFAEFQHPVIGSYKDIAAPVNMSETPGVMRSAAPTLGQHTEEVLQKLGLGDAELSALRADGVIL